jgi:predicted nucleotidyltransferase
LKPAADEPERFAAKTNVFPVIDVKSGIRIDFIFSFSAYEREALKRARQITISGVKVKYISAEDLIIHKLIAGRPRDIEDVKNVMLKNRRLDLKYIRKWLKSFDESLSVNHVYIFEGILKRIKSE